MNNGANVNQKILEKIDSKTSENKTLNNFIKDLIEFERDSSGYWNSKYNEILDKYSR